MLSTIQCLLEAKTGNGVLSIAFVGVSSNLTHGYGVGSIGKFQSDPYLRSFARLSNRTLNFGIFSSKKLLYCG